MNGLQWFCLFAFSVTIASAGEPKLPDLAQLKLAAERGDPVAQFDYSQRLWASTSPDRLEMLVKSAAQGYGPTEDSLGGHYVQRVPFEKERAKTERLAVRFTARAAFKGIAAAQARMASFYEQGLGVPKNPVLAYGWLAVAAKVDGRDPFMAGAFRAQLNHLITRITSGAIADGQKWADKFRPSSAGLEVVENDLVISKLKVSAFFSAGGKAGALVNQVRFMEGETKTLQVDGAPVELRCIAVLGKTVQMRLGSQTFSLASK